MSVGSEVRRLRKDAGLTLYQLAARLSVSAPFICDIEHNRRAIPPARIQEFADALDTTPRHLEGLQAYDRLPEWLRRKREALRLLKLIQRERFARPTRSEVQP